MKNMMVKVLRFIQKECEEIQINKIKKNYILYIIKKKKKKKKKKK